MKSIKSFKSIIENILFKSKILDNEKYKQEIIENELNHPERLAVLPYCEKGKGIDVGCGHRKTTENCIGVDIIPKGVLGTAGCVKNKTSQADICTSADDLHMFKYGELDFLIARHNLEHYVDVIKTLREWKRVLKQNGVMAVIVPDEDGLNKVGKR